MAVDIESQPLLFGQTTVNVRRSRKWARMAVYSVLGVFFLTLYNLLFLPRTSVARDWRRLHSSQVSLYDLERSLFRSISSDSIRHSAQKYATVPHVAGEGYELAQWTSNQFGDCGFESEIVPYDIYLNTPVDAKLTVVDSEDESDIKYEAKLKEDPVDDTLNDTLPIFHGYSASGDVTEQYVYVNFGRKEDFDLLQEKGVSVEGKIVIARYGHIFRGLKVKFAQEHGAKGVLIYDDPEQDSGVTEEEGEKPYPEGPARNPSAIQRGSVQFLPDGPGDPTTPGWASRHGDKHVKRVDPQGIPRIPSLPISMDDAKYLLKALDGKGEKIDEWQGGFPFDYYLGPSNDKVHLYSAQDYSIKPVYNVIAKMPGIISDEAVILGNHRDAWGSGGAADPNSGSAVLMELARAFRDMRKLGWRPARTIILASWDGEEYGLLGSTEWVEDHFHYLKEHVVAYLNVDVAVSGSEFSASASPVLNELLYKVSKKVPDTDTAFERNVPLVGERDVANTTGSVMTADKRDFEPPNTEYASTYDGDVDPSEASLFSLWKSQSDARISTLGSGSDYTAFQDFVGIPSLDVGFSRGKNDPVYHYHSNYDSFAWMDEYGDPTWARHVTLARLWGLLALQLSEQELIQFKLRPYSKVLLKYIDKLDDDSSKGLSKLKSVALKLDKNAEEYDKYTDMLQDEYTRDYAWYHSWKKVVLLFRIKVANVKLFRFERSFIYDEGLDNRSWFKHIVFAPGRYTGYAGTVLPGLSEAIEDGDKERASKWAKIICKAIKHVNYLIA